MWHDPVPQLVGRLETGSRRISDNTMTMRKGGGLWISARSAALMMLLRAPSTLSFGMYSLVVLIGGWFFFTDRIRKNGFIYNYIFIYIIYVYGFIYMYKYNLILTTLYIYIYKVFSLLSRFGKVACFSKHMLWFPAAKDTSVRLCITNCWCWCDKQWDSVGEGTGLKPTFGTQIISNKLSSS